MHNFINVIFCVGLDSNIKTTEEEMCSILNIINKTLKVMLFTDFPRQMLITIKGYYCSLSTGGLPSSQSLCAFTYIF